MPTVLIVADDHDTRFGYSAFLANAGVCTMTAAAGRAGLAIARAAQIDVMVVELALADISAIDLLREIRQQGTSMPAVIVTGLGSAAMAFEAGSLGAAGFLEKPINGERLTRLVMDVISRQSANGRSDIISPPDDRIVRVIEHIHMNLANDLSMPELASVATLSPSRLRRLFRLTLGVPLSRYRLDCRLALAADLLTRSLLKNPSV